MQLFARAAGRRTRRAAELVAAPEEWNGQRTARPDALALGVLDLLLQRPECTWAAVGAHFSACGDGP